MQTLTAKSKYTEIFNVINDHKFDVLELRFDTDDYVVRALEADPADIFAYYEATHDADIDEYEVYYVNSDAHDDPATAAYEYLELNLQGRTLYITADQSDTGLAMASDALAVVIQDEYNKTDVKTEFTTVKSAISHLADADPSTTAMEYDGKIFAALNANGSAAWIVFDSSTGLNTTSGIDGSTTGNVPTALTESTASGTYQVGVNGILQATFNYNAPEYVADGSTVKFDVTVYNNGVYMGKETGETGIVNNGKSTVNMISNVWAYYGC